jgi:hypothetical protein
MHHAMGTEVNIVVGFGVYLFMTMKVGVKSKKNLQAATEIFF